MSSQFRGFADSRLWIIASSLFLKTHFTNFMNLDVSRVAGFPEFPNTNLASPGLLEQPVSSNCGMRLLARVRQQVTWVDLPTPSINSRLRCRHPPSPTLQPRGTTLATLLETVVPHRSRLAAASLLETATAHLSCLAAASLLAVSLLPPESTWVVRLLAVTL
jgi:hypothetical protein